MDVLRALPLKHVKRLPVGLLAGTTLAGGPTYVDQKRTWRMPERQWRTTWTSVAVATQRYGQALSWHLPILVNPTAEAGITLTVSASGWNPDESVTVVEYSGTLPLPAQPWLCPPGRMQQVQLTFERERLSVPSPEWGLPTMLLFQGEKVTGVPIDWQEEVDDALLHRMVGFFAASQPNPSGVVPSHGSTHLWEAQAGVYLDGRDALVDVHFLDFAYGSTEVDTLPTLDTTPLLTHPPMLYPYRQVLFSETPTGLAINAGGSIQAD